jgi:protocatechuate 3,4-dioxygenase beta subunit
VRKTGLVAAVVVGLTLAAVLTRKGDGTGEAARGSPAPGAPARAPLDLTPVRPSTFAAAPQPERPADVSPGGSAEPGSTPPLSEPPRAEDGLLDVQVVADGAPEGPRPVAGAAVRLYWRGPPDARAGGPAWRLAGEGRTDAQGRLSLPSRPGAYLVAARAEGLAPSRREVVRPFGEARTAVRLALAKGLALTGTTVVKGGGEPLALVELSLTQHTGAADGFAFRAAAPPEERVWGSSDARGAFRLEGLAPGTYLLEARAPGHARAVLPRVRVPAGAPLTVALGASGFLEGFVVDAAGRPAAGAEVHVGGRAPQVLVASEAGAFSAEVEPGPHPVQARRGEEAGALEAPVTVAAGATVKGLRVRLGAGGVLEGVVRARGDGRPVAGAAVEAGPFQAQPFAARGTSARTVTDASGAFRLAGLAPDGYDVTVSAAGFSRAVRRGVTVAGGERFPLEVLLEGVGAVAGEVRDGQGRPVAGARVRGGSRWGGGLGSAPAEALTDASGVYRLEGLDAGRVLVTARREGDALGSSARVEVREGEVARADLTLAETGVVEGVVRPSRGALPEGGLVVRAFPQRGGVLGPADMASAETDAAGAFRLVLPAGTYGLRPFPLVGRGPSFGTRAAEVAVEAGGTVRAELAWEEAEADGRTLRVRVLEPDGSPSPGAAVDVRAGEGGRRFAMVTPADEEGRAEVTGPEGAAEAAGLVVTARNGGRSGAVPGVRPGGGEVVVRLRPAAGVRGRVVRADGQPVQGFLLQVRTGDTPGPLLPAGREFAGATFSLPDVPAEPATLVASTPDGLRGELPLALAPGQQREVEVVLRGTAGLVGRILDASGAPLAGAVVAVEGAEGPGGFQETDAAGRFRFERLPPGERRVLMHNGPMARAERRVQLVEGQAADLGEVRLEPWAAPLRPPARAGPGAP